MFNEGGGSGNDSGSVSGDVSVISGSADGSSGGVVGGSGGTGGVSGSVSGGSSEENNADVDFFSGVRRLFGGGDNSDVDSVVPDNDSDVVPEGEVTVSLTQNEQFEIEAVAEFDNVLKTTMSIEKKISTLTTILKNTKANEVKYNMGNENSNEMATQLAKLLIQNGKFNEVKDLITPYEFNKGEVLKELFEKNKHRKFGQWKGPFKNVNRRYIT